ncbi:hypothetical protein KAW38_01570 [Candidatus Micrarchaeota archaeon]|nr:hypothetical protein [Candidatus Micrarchaeota archaeon]
MRSKLHHNKIWKVFVSICFWSLILVMGLEILSHEMNWELLPQMSFDILDFGLGTIVLFDIWLGYKEAADKWKYLRKNIIKIVAVFPLGVFFKFLRFERVVELIPLLSELPVLEGFFGAEKGVRSLAKLKEILE